MDTAPHWSRRMRCGALAPILSLACLSAQETLYEKKEMTAITSCGQLKILGSWDAEGVPTILDLCYTNHEDRKLFSKYFWPNRLWRAVEGGTKPYMPVGISILDSSDGTGRKWDCHIPMPGVYTQFKLMGPGLKEVPVKVEADGPGAPPMKVWEDGKGQFRWQVDKAWQVQARVSIDEGVNWVFLGAGNSGQADLRAYLGQKPVVLFQAFKGLRSFLDVYIPGQGIQPHPHPWHLPLHFKFNARENGGGERDFLMYPVFRCGVRASRMDDFESKARILPGGTPLPFELAKLIPKGKTQLLFQVEWKGLAETYISWDCSVEIATCFLADPKNLKNPTLYRISQNKQGNWEIQYSEKMRILERDPGFFSVYVLIWPKLVKFDVHSADYNTYWLITSD